MSAGTEMATTYVTTKTIWNGKAEISSILYVLLWNSNVYFYWVIDDFDTVYIAHCYPYTYTKLQLYLRDIESDPKRKHLVQRKTLCQTITGNNCDYVIISDFNNGK